MTPQQTKTLTFIVGYQKQYGYVPSTIISAKYFKVTHQTMAKHYKALISLGKLKKKEKVSHFEVV